MSLNKQRQSALKIVESQQGRRQDILDRFREELNFADQLVEHVPARRAEWEALMLRAIKVFQADLDKGRSAAEALAGAEAVMAPIGQIAKTYTIHCVGHAHIDMNWMWSWPETVAVVNDTFTTVDRLMDEFPDFCFSQSQASVYQIMKDYQPELYARIKARIKAGRWEVSASQWVEGDKNMASGESLCRHLLYTRRFCRQEFGLPYDAVKIDWEPDTFGHALTVPTILGQGGIRWYYLHRGGSGPQLFWWQARDGARVLVFDDCVRAYNGAINPAITRGLLQFEQATGLKDYLFVYGVGDHGGGPTRKYLQTIRQLDAWPVFPRIAFSTLERFFSIAEIQARDLPVIDRELNYVFEGCYSSQSKIKYANRRSENALGEAEAFALLGRGLAGLSYPAEELDGAWRNTLFNQFHDILPGSGVQATCEYTQGLFQESMARTSMIKTHALRKIVEGVDIAAIKVNEAGSADSGNQSEDAMDAGHGNLGLEGAISQRGPGAGSDLACVVFNPNPWQRAETVTLRIWDRPGTETAYQVYDDSGQSMPAQVVERGAFWGHSFIDLLFPSARIPALGYRSYRIVPAAEQAATIPGVCVGDRAGGMENEYFKVEVEQASGAIVHLVDKASGIDLVPPGGRLGLLEYILEAPHGMTAWILGQPLKTIPLLEGGSLECPLNGPYRASVCTGHTLNDSTFKLTVALSAGVPRIDFTLDLNWLERGSAATGVPALKAIFPLAVADGVARFEIPFGQLTRSTRKNEIVTLTSKSNNCYAPTRQGIDANPAEVPAQKWVDLSGRLPGCAAPGGASLLNDSKYGHSVVDNVIRLTLLRSSYEPDPLPELGQHTIRFALRPHVGEWTAYESTRAGYDFNLPLSVVAATAHSGKLPVRDSFAEILTPQVMLGGLKKAEDSDALIVRLYEMEGRVGVARLRLGKCLARAGAQAVVTDVMEQPLAHNSARMEGDVLHVAMPAFGLVTVKVG